MKCPHCKQGTLVRDNWYYNHAVKCQICGYWKENAAPAKMEKFGREAWIASAKHGASDTRPEKASRLVSCPVVGCNGKMVATNPNGMCNMCWQKLKVWEGGKRTTVAPIVKGDDGLWHRMRMIAVMEAA